MATTLSDVMNLMGEVRAIDAQNFEAGDDVLEMLRRQIDGFETAKSEYRVMVASKDATITLKTNEYAALNERNVEVGARLTAEQAARQSIASQLETTNVLLADKITDVTIKNQLLGQAEQARAEALVAFNAEKSAMQSLLDGRDATIATRDSQISELDVRIETLTTDYQTSLDAIAEQLRLILAANISEDQDIRDVASQGVDAWKSLPGTTYFYRKINGTLDRSANGVTVETPSLATGLEYAFLSASGGRVYGKVADDDSMFYIENGNLGQGRTPVTSDEFDNAANTAGMVEL